MANSDPAANAASATSMQAKRNAHLAHIAWVRNSGMSVLLALLVTSVFITPALVPDGAHWRLILDVLVTLIMISGVVAVLEHRKTAAVLAVLSAVVIVAHWIEGSVPASVLPILRETSTLIGLLVLAFAVGINVFASGHAIGDRVFGAIVLYLLIAMIFAVIYAALEVMAPGAYSGIRRQDAGLADWVYFSFVTLTTVGYGDILPVARAARSLAMLEALIGQLYPAIIIARLVSLQTSAK